MELKLKSHIQFWIAIILIIVGNSISVLLINQGQEFILLYFVIGVFTLLVFSVSKYRVNIAIWLYLLTLLIEVSQLGNSTLDVLRWIWMIVACILGMWSLHMRGPRNIIAVGLVGLGIYASLTSLYSYTPLVSLLKSLSLVLLGGVLVFAIPAVKMQSNSTLQRYFLHIYYLMSVGIVLSNGLLLLMQPEFAFLGGNFRGWVDNPNGLGALIGTFVVSILFFKISRPNLSLLQKLVLGIILVLAVVELFASRSRGGMLAALTGTLIVGWRQKGFALMIGLALLLLLVGTFIPSLPISRALTEIIYKNESSIQGSGRLLIWQNMLEDIRRSPLIGNGLGVADVGTAGAFVFNSGGYTIEKSNSYLALLDELGYFGALIFATLILFPFVRKMLVSIKVSSPCYSVENIALIAIILAGAIDAFFEAWMFAVGSFYCVTFWIFTFLLMARKSSTDEVSLNG